MKRLVSCAITFCLAFSLFGVPSIAFAKDALASSAGAQSDAVENASGSNQASSDGTSSSQSSQATGSDEGESGSQNSEPVVDSVVPQGNVKEVVDGDVTFFGIDDVEAQADGAASKAKGSQLAGSQVTVRLRSQIHPTSPDNNLTTDFGVKAVLLDGDKVIATAEFVPAKSSTSGANGDAQILGDYVATFSDRIPQGSYELRVSGQNYLTHIEKDFFVEDGNRVNVELVDMVTSSSSDTSSSVTVNSGNSIQGLLPYGDFNGDGRIDNNDTWEMTSALSQLPPTSATITKFDINADGAFNLLDTQYFATTIKEGNDTASSVEELIKVIHGTPVITKDCSQTSVSTSDGIIKIGNIGAGDGAPGEGDDGSDSFTGDAIREALFENADLSVILEQAVPISEENPISLDIETAAPASDDPDAAEAPVIEMEGLTIRPPAETTSNKTDGDVSALSSGMIAVEDENGTVHEFAFKNGQQTNSGRSYSLFDTLLRSGSEQAIAASPSNPIVIDFGTRIAIKKITIKVTATTRPDATLAEIGKVEFLNNMADRIDPPDLSVPTNLKGEPGDKKITFTWDAQQNITAYEIRVTDPTGKTTTSSTVLPTFSISDKKMKSGTYTAAVRSTNGEWKSPWSADVTTELVPTKRPDMPTNITVKAGYCELVVSWPDVDDAAYYTLYYWEEGTSDVVKLDNITTTRQVLSKLKASTTYVLYLTASNDFGTSPKSEDRVGVTLGGIDAKVPWYNLINRTVQHQEGTSFETWNDEAAKLNDNIESVTATADNDESINPGFDPYWMVDGDYGTCYMPKRMSTYYDGARVKFDRAYEMDSMIVTSSFMDGYGYTSVADIRVNVMDDEGNWTYYKMADGKVTTSAVGSKAPNSFWVKFPKSNVKEIVVGSMRAYGWKAPISEVAFYKYDSLGNDLNALWADELHTTLKGQLDDGTKIDAAYLDSLEERINTKDPDTIVSGDATSGECTPNQDIYLKSLELARQALEFQGGIDPVRVRSAITADGANVGGINGWQPLGVAAKEGDKLQIFVGGRLNGSSDPIGSVGPTPLVLGVSQNGGEGKDLYTTINGPGPTGQLVYGLNEITVPATPCTIYGQEKGGQLYVISQTSNKNSEFDVRVIGGAPIARLDLYKVTNDDTYRERCEAYVDQLRDQVENLQKTHSDLKHEEAYKDDACVANTTDIMLTSIMFSVPASRILDGLGRNASRDEQVEKLIKSTKSSEDMVQLYWQHKGLGVMTTAEQQTYGGKNGVPAGHLNIRFMRMNPGVFMYAAGNHVGIQYGSCTLTGTPGVTYDENGKWQSGYYFGWGIAHEIGHQINQGAYTYAEVTNNYYAQLITANDTNERSRYKYPTLYNRVTSGVQGPPAGGTGIGLYWQLHLAYDNGYNYKKYSNYTDMYNNLVMARIDSIARNPEKAPGEGFTLAGADKDNAFMRLACAAAGDAQTGFGRNILDYFVAWGQTPDETTIAYASQFEKDGRPLQYINDDARVYRLEGGESVGANTEVWANLYEGDASSIGDDSKKITDSKVVNTRQVTLEMGISGDAANKTNGLIGFEVLRNGTPVAFQMFNPTKSGEQNTSGYITYTDTIVTENNRTYTYEVRAVDNLLAYSKNTVTFPQVKVSDNGTYSDKSRWTASTNMTSAADEGYDTSGDNAGVEGDAASSCEQDLVKKAVDAVIDGDTGSVYTGTLPTGDDVPKDAAGEPITLGAPYIEVDFGTTLQVTGVTVSNEDLDTLRASAVQVTSDGSTWTTLPLGTGKATGDGKGTTCYFDVAGDNQLKIYTASKMRLVAAEGTAGMTLRELDVLGPAGDNADFLTSDGWVGYIDADTTYAPEPEGSEGAYTIPKGSLVFVGSYSGDTAYNALKMFAKTSGDFGLIGGTQVLFAEEPGEGRNLGVTADGRWIYYITPAEMAEEGWTLPSEVYAELYRVDDAMTLANERLVASTLTLKIPDSIPTIHLSIGGMTDGTFQPIVGN